MFAFVNMFQYNTTSQGCLLYVKRLLYAVMPCPLQLSPYYKPTHCDGTPTLSSWRQMNYQQNSAVLLKKIT